jgi:hypothetical protein
VTTEGENGDRILANKSPEPGGEKKHEQAVGWGENVDWYSS